MSRPRLPVQCAGQCLNVDTFSKKSYKAERCSNVCRFKESIFSRTTPLLLLSMHAKTVCMYMQISITRLTVDVTSDVLTLRPNALLFRTNVEKAVSS